MKLFGNIGVLAVAAFFLLQGCDKEKTTESGLTYTVIREGNGKLPVDGDHVVLQMTYGLGDSLLEDTSNSAPIMLEKNDSLWNSGGMIHEIFGKMKEGDSVMFSVDAQTLFADTWKQQLPPEIAPDAQFKFNVSIDTVVSKEDFPTYQQRLYDKERVRYEAEQAVQLEKDIELLNMYFEDNDISPEVTESGLRYVIHENGNGVEANPLDTVSVSYTGYLLSGEIFDTSNEELAKENGIYSEGRPYQPMEFVIGRSRIIRAMHEGIDSLNVGDKATLFVPSKLGYGPNAQGPQIPPNTVLLFDVELVDVKN